MSEVFRVYSLYTGTGIMMILFFVSLMYIGLRDHNKSNVSLLFFGPIVLVFLIFLPPVHMLYERFVDATTYWRMWWTVPVGIGLSYVGACLFEKHRVTGLILSLVVLMLGGSFVYRTQGDFMAAENAYQLPQEAIDVADALEEAEEGYITAAVYPGLVMDIRQYDDAILLAFGREMLDDSMNQASEETEKFFLEMLQPSPNFEVLLECCRTTGTEYVVLLKSQLPLTSPEESDFSVVSEIGSYVIYRCNPVDAYYKSTLGK